jgi:diguanylate cyclase (GGDEF)-like protein
MSKITKKSQIQLQQQFEMLLDRYDIAADTNPTLALEIALEAREIAFRLGTELEIATTFRLEGLCYLKLSNYTKVLKIIHHALEIFEKIQYFPQIIACQIDIGIAYLKLGDFPDCLEWFELALANSKKHKKRYGILHCLSSLFDVESKLGNLDRALVYAQQSLEIALELGDREIAHAQDTLGNTYVKLGQKMYLTDKTLAFQHFMTGINLLQLSRKAHQQSPIHGFEVNSFIIEAIALAEMGQYDQAFRASDRALEVAKGDKDPSIIADSENNRGWLLKKTGQTLESIQHYEKALAIYEQLGRKSEASEVHKELAEVQHTQGQYAIAYDHLQKYYALDIQLRFAASDGRAQALAAKLDLERIQHEAQVHRIKSEELTVLNEKLQEQAVLLEKIAREDELTGLPNRRKFEEFASIAFRNARAKKLPFSIVIGDLDSFKKINDTFGHAIGDAVMRVLGDLLKEHCPEHGLAARFGGEEFVLVLPGFDGQAAFEKCEKIRLAVQTYHWQPLHPDLHVTISFGLSAHLEAQSHERLLSIADLCLYQAKNSGRNCTQPNFTSQNTQPTILERRKQERRTQR